ncbi:MAG: BON domain-containing protein [Candidatus Acidiferrales bacterium]
MAILKYRTFILSVACSAIILFATTAGAVPATRQQHSTSTRGDNTAQISEQVRHQLVMLPWLSVFDNLEYRVDGDKVTLMGQVVLPALKDEATSAVKKVEGVAQVDNQIEILPPSPMDARLRRQELRSIYSYPPLQRYGMGTLPGIHIIVDGGHVTLEGVVDNQADKDAANIRANQVPGVFSVTNNLRVQKQS